MKFDSDKSFASLCKLGIVATQRHGEYHQGQVIDVTHNGDSVGEGIIVGKFLNNSYYRHRLYKVSGFGSVTEWEREAERLHGDLPKHILLVLLTEEYASASLEFP